MKDLILFVLLILGLSFVTFCKDTTDQNRLYFSGIGQYYPNKINVHNNANEPDLIQAKNTFGYSAFVEYQRIMASGLTLNIGVGISEKTHDISIVKDLRSYGSANLPPFDIHNIKIKLRSIDPEIMLGYCRPTKKGYTFFAKIGMQQKRFNDRVFENVPMFKLYKVAPQFYQGALMYSYETYLGRVLEADVDTKSKILLHPTVLRFSIGGEWGQSFYVVRSVYVGLESAIRIFNSIPQNIVVYSYDGLNGNPSKSKYIDDMASIGLKVGVNVLRVHKKYIHSTDIRPPNWQLIN